MYRELRQLADRVYIYPRDETPDVIQPNVGVIRLHEQTILIDAGNSPRHARRIMSAMNAINFAPVDTIIYTHHHWDHCFGASAWNATMMIGHQRTAAYLKEHRSRAWHRQALREAIQRNPKLEISYNALSDAIPDWREFRIVLPTITFSDHLSLYYDGLTLDLLYVGGRHADDSIVVRVREAGILFLGDCYYPLPYHLRPDGDEDLDIAMLEMLLGQDANLYVDGHGNPYTHDEFAQMIAMEQRRQQSLRAE